MPLLTYVAKKFSAEHSAIIRQAREICDAYAEQGYDLTLRQLYYQFVARDLLANTTQSYKRLGSIINDARLAGLLDWNHIVDRTRNLRGLSHWDDPADIVNSAAASFRIDKWADQTVRVEVWIEKDALTGVIEGVCVRNDVPFFSCRGYTSQSEVWGAARRLRRHIQDRQRVVILHLGDHDPSGIDMSRDIEDRLKMFVYTDHLRDHVEDMKKTDPDDYATHRAIVGDICRRHEIDGPPLEVRRIALNWDQIEEYDPPPNPAKLTDSRARGYIAEHGRESWELDALEPAVLDALIEEHIETLRDESAWRVACQTEETEREVLTEAAGRWDEVKEFLDEGGSE